MSYEIPKAFTVVLLFHPLYIFVFLSNPGLGFYKGWVYLVKIINLRVIRVLQFPTP